MWLSLDSFRYQRALLGIPGVRICCTRRFMLLCGSHNISEDMHSSVVIIQRPLELYYWLCTTVIIELCVGKIKAKMCIKCYEAYFSS